jgi:Tfp pilus assembly protein PilV
MSHARIHTEDRAFTLIETLAAVLLLTVAIMAPMSLVTNSVSAGYYSRDQITASHLAQEAIEAVQHIRDNNILAIVTTGSSVDTFAGIPVGSAFTIHTLDNTIQNCSPTCPPLQIDASKTFYGYGSGWTDTRFTRTVLVETVLVDAGGVPQEMKITSTVTWRTGGFQQRSISMQKHLYRWVADSTVP